MSDTFRPSVDVDPELAQDDPAAFLAHVAEQLPFNAHLGVRVGEVGDGRGEVVLPDADHLVNHVGTVHAVAELAAAEPAGAMAASSGVLDLVQQGYVPIVKRMSVEYLKPAKGELRATAEMSEEDASSLRKAAEAGERVAVTLPIQVRDADGVVAEVTAEYVYKQLTG